MQGRHILITGAGSGIGLGIARLLHQEGAVLHMTGRRGEPLEEAAREMGDGIFTYTGDLASAQDRADLVAEVTANSGGRLDGLVQNAARYAYQMLDDSPLDDFEAMFAVNVTAPFALTSALRPLLAQGEGKSVVMISSTLGAKPVAGTGAYAASKAALNSLTQTFALEWAGAGIRVNGVLPGVVDTPIHDPGGEGEPSRAEKMSMFAEQHPLGRVGQPKDVAEMVSFLLSERSSWMTGALINVDGGIGLA